MSAIIRRPAPRTLRVIASGPAGTAKNFVPTVIGMPYLLRRLAVLANHDTRVLAP
ncbi:hypothetical protein RCH06_001870 [Polaromonas sp. CG_9.5]|uniref:hypothetical protein n=1 Tax=Polaromonas sp. CG_9.5 TaxID=3071705 RepID=UPI002E0014D4|nr:hypothetical protein [Polaromonas sp. CG_9.5]